NAATFTLRSTLIGTPGKLVTTSSSDGIPQARTSAQPHSAILRGTPNTRAPSGSCEATSTPSAVAWTSVSSASTPSSSARRNAGRVFSRSSRHAPRWAYTRAVGIAAPLLALLPAAGMADVGAAHHVDDLLGHVVGVVSQLLAVFGDEEQAVRAPDVAGILHHQPEQLVHQVVVDGVEQVVVLDHGLGLRRVALHERVQRRPHLPLAQLRQLGEIVDGLERRALVQI